MGILEIFEKYSAGSFRDKAQYIRLSKPVLNIFVGDFKTEELKTLTDLMENRVGTVKSIQYALLCFGKKQNKPENERIKVFRFEKAATPKEFSLEARLEFQESVEKNCDFEERFSAYIEEISDAVSTEQYSYRGQIRVNLLIRAEEFEAAALKYWLPVMQNLLSDYFPNMVRTDAYVFLDQRAQGGKYGNQKRAFTYLTLEEIDQMAKAGAIQMPFCLSNQTSQNCLELYSMQDRIRTAGLMMLVKDGITSERGENSYSDEEFASDCSGYGDESWYSLGHFHMDVEEELIKLIVCRELLRQLLSGNDDLHLDDYLRRLELMEVQIQDECREMIAIPQTVDRIFYSMVKNTGVNAAGMVSNSRKNIIDAVYGANLDLFFQLNCGMLWKERMEEQMQTRKQKITSTFEAFQQEGTSLADMNRIMGWMLECLNDVLKKKEQEEEAKRSELEVWCTERAGIANLRDRSKETGEPVAFYRLGQQYLAKKASSLHATMMRCALERYIEIIEQIRKPYQASYRMLETAERDLTGAIFRLEREEKDKREILVENCQIFYGALTQKLVKNRAEIQAFLRSLEESMKGSSFNENNIFMRLIEFCGTNIMFLPEFEKNFEREMLQRLMGSERFDNKESIYELVITTIMENQKFYALVDTYQTPACEICFLVNSDNEFVKSTSEYMQRLRTNQQMKLFKEEHFDDMDVLFMEGRFDIKNLHLFTRYQQIFEKQNNMKGAVNVDGASQKL